MNSRVVSFLQTQLSNQPGFVSSVLELWHNHLAQGLANPHFVTEFTNGDRRRFFQRLWEMLLGAYFGAQGFHLTSPDHGPDLRFEIGGLTIWVEAISPEPKGLPEHWMQIRRPARFRPVLCRTAKSFSAGRPPGEGPEAEVLSRRRHREARRSLRYSNRRSPTRSDVARSRDFAITVRGGGGSACWTSGYRDRP
jgi:hypothetical protein